MGLATAVAICWLSTPALAQDPKEGAPPKDAPKQAPPKRAAPAQAPKQAPKAQANPQAPAQRPAKGPAGDTKSLDDAPAEPSCPPGAFCEQHEVAPPEEQAKPRVYLQNEEVESDEAEAEPPQQDSTTVTLPPAREGQDPKKPRTFTYIPDPDGGPGQIIVYEDGAAPPHLPGERISRRASVPPPPPPAEDSPRRLFRHRRWGVNLRVEGAILPRHRGGDDIGMAGLGLSLRYRPVGHFALDLGADFLGGHDANAFARQEIPLSASAMVYVNPRSLAQFYFMGGVNWSWARVSSEETQPNLANGTGDDYTYVGGHGGIGLEFRVSPLIGINVDGLAFVRTRTDDDANGRYPEFVDPDTGATSNTSVAGLVRAGVTFWW